MPLTSETLTASRNAPLSRNYSPQAELLIVTLSHQTSTEPGARSQRNNPLWAHR